MRERIVSVLMDLLPSTSTALIKAERDSACEGAGSSCEGTGSSWTAASSWARTQGAARREHAAKTRIRYNFSLFTEK